jgi:hypothetical protein
MSRLALRPITTSAGRVGALWGLILLASIPEGNCVLGAAGGPQGAAVDGLRAADTGPASGGHAPAPGRDSQVRMCVKGSSFRKILLTMDLAAC